MLAAELGYLRIVRVILKHGANVSLPNIRGETALHFSAYHNHLAVSKALVKAGADLEAKADYVEGGQWGIRHIGHTPLHVAVNKGFHDLIEALVRAGANVDSVSRSSRTPLYLAAELGRVQAVKVLLRAKANPFVAEDVASTILAAVFGGHLPVVRELVQRVGVDGCTRDGGVDALLYAATVKHARMIAFLCDAGVVDTKGMALCAAIGSCDEESVKVLLKIRGGNSSISVREYVNMVHTYDNDYYGGP